MLMITVSDYKSYTGRLSIGRKVIIQKPDNGRQRDVVIIRYELKSYPIFRIERASKVNSFDLEKISDIINTELQPYRIGE